MSEQSSSKNQKPDIFKRSLDYIFARLSIFRTQVLAKPKLLMHLRRLSRTMTVYMFILTLGATIQMYYSTQPDLWPLQGIVVTFYLTTLVWLLVERLVRMSEGSSTTSSQG